MRVRLWPTPDDSAMFAYVGGESSARCEPFACIAENASSDSYTILTWRLVGYVPLRKYSWMATSSGENSSTQRAGLPSRPPRPASCA